MVAVCGLGHGNSPFGRDGIQPGRPGLCIPVRVGCMPGSLELSWGHWDIFLRTDDALGYIPVASGIPPGAIRVFFPGTHRDISRARRCFFCAILAWHP